MEKTTIHINLDKDLKRYIEKKAKEKGLSLSSYIRMLLMEKMQNEK